MSQITPSAELVAVVKRWLTAYSQGDKETVTNLLSSDPALTFIGSADGETWHGPDLPRTLARYMDEFGSFQWDAFEARGFASGKLGWVDIHCDTFVDHIGKKASFRCSFVLTLEKGVWKIVHVHNSNPVPNEQALGYQARGFEDLLEVALESALHVGKSGLATIMFTDIADSTALAEALGDARWTRAVSAHVEETRGIVEAHEGRLIKSLGDGTLSTFSSTRAALACAKALQSAASETDEPRLRIRIGVHTGDVVETDGDALGTVVNKAARVAAIAAPEEIRVSDATRAMVGGSQDFTFAEPITVPLKGLEGDHLIHRLEWSA